MFFEKGNLRVRRQISLSGPGYQRERLHLGDRSQLMEKWLSALPRASRTFVHLLIYHVEIVYLFKLKYQQYWNSSGILCVFYLVTAE